MDELFSKGFKEVKASFKPNRVRVAVEAPFGEGAKAAAILDKFEPLAADDTKWEDEGAASGSAAARKPFDWSKISELATPLSDFFNWRVLSDKKSPFWPEVLNDDPTPLSKKMNWAVLSAKDGDKNPGTPLSNSLNWSVLSTKKSPFWPEKLMDDAAPLSNKFGWSVLQKDK